MYLETGGAGGRRVRLTQRAVGVLVAELPVDRARQGRKITLLLMKGSDLQADLASGYADRAAVRARQWTGRACGILSTGIDSRTGRQKVLLMNACPISDGMQLNSK